MWHSCVLPWRYHLFLCVYRGYVGQTCILKVAIEFLICILVTLINTRNVCMLVIPHYSKISYFACLSFALL